MLKSSLNLYSKWNLLLHLLNYVFDYLRTESNEIIKKIYISLTLSLYLYIDIKL
jgi:hypothetical protein